jgi:hypothetical protein
MRHVVRTTGRPCFGWYHRFVEFVSLAALVHALPEGVPDATWLSAALQRHWSAFSTGGVRAWSVGGVQDNETLVQSRPVVRDPRADFLADLLRVPTQTTLAAYAASPPGHGDPDRPMPAIAMTRFQRWVGVRAEAAPPTPTPAPPSRAAPARLPGPQLRRPAQRPRAGRLRLPRRTSTPTAASARPTPAPRADPPGPAPPSTSASATPSASTSSVRRPHRRRAPPRRPVRRLSRRPPARPRAISQPHLRRPAASSSSTPAPRPTPRPPSSSPACSPPASASPAVLEREP